MPDHLRSFLSRLQEVGRASWSLGEICRHPFVAAVVLGACRIRPDGISGRQGLSARGERKAFPIRARVFSPKARVGCTGRLSLRDYSGPGTDTSQRHRTSSRSHRPPISDALISILARNILNPRCVSLVNGRLCSMVFESSYPDRVGGCVKKLSFLAFIGLCLTIRGTLQAHQFDAQFGISGVHSQ